jgi:hypothetical protein
LELAHPAHSFDTCLGFRRERHRAGAALADSGNSPELAAPGGVHPPRVVARVSEERHRRPWPPHSEQRLPPRPSVVALVSKKRAASVRRPACNPAGARFGYLSVSSDRMGNGCFGDNLDSDLGAVRRPASKVWRSFPQRLLTAGAVVLPAGCTCSPREFPEAWKSRGFRSWGLRRAFTNWDF